MTELIFISEKNRARYLRIIAPVGKFFAKLGVHPNILSITGFVLSVAAGIIYSMGSFFWAAWVVVLAGTCDALDGQIARQTNNTSSFGAFFDSTLDRYSDMFLYIGLAYHFSGGPAFMGIHPSASNHADPSPWTVMVIVMAVAGSFMVSYTRARAEGLGLECKKGLMQRPERIILLIIGSLLGVIPVMGALLLKLALLLLAVSTNLTAVYRIMVVRRHFARGSVAK